VVDPERPVLIALCGLPFSGKSTLARRLAERPGWVWLETDAIARESRAADVTPPRSRRDWVEVYRESYLRLEADLAAGRTVVYDATNFRRLMRDRLRQSSARWSAPMLVVVDTPAEVVAQRRRANLGAQTRPNVPDADFDDVAARFQWPTPDERPLRYDPEAPFDAWFVTMQAMLRREASGTAAPPPDRSGR
jgi:predicted kinase